MAITARENGILRLVANVLPDSPSGQAVLRDLGATFRRDPVPGA